jgi:signal peptidase I
MGLETIGDATHLVQEDQSRPARDFSVQVKPGHYFMMGDNRDNSSDSRIWGQVPEKDIVGKAFAVWMHWDSLFSIPSFSRVGLIE